MVVYDICYLLIHLFLAEIFGRTQLESIQFAELKGGHDTHTYTKFLAELLTVITQCNFVKHKFHPLKSTRDIYILPVIFRSVVIKRFPDFL